MRCSFGGLKDFVLCQISDLSLGVFAHGHSYSNSYDSRESKFIWW